MNICTECEKRFEQTTCEILSKFTNYRNHVLFDDEEVKDVRNIIGQTLDLVEEDDEDKIESYRRCVCDSCNLIDLPKDVNFFLYKRLFEYLKENIEAFKRLKFAVDEIRYKLNCLIKVDERYKVYYLELFGIPYELRRCNIPQEHYQLRKDTYFGDVIAGHPMASHGWFAEGLNELIEMGVIVN